MKTPIHPARGPGFTLIELLVTIGIVAVLAALIFSTSRTVIQSSQRGGSMSNLKSIASLGAVYSSDHNGAVFPYRTDEWGGSPITGDPHAFMMEFLPRQYGDQNYNVFRRPGDKLASITGTKRIFNNKIPWSYARNLSLPLDRKMHANPQYCSFNPLILSNPSKTMLLMETAGNAGIDASLKDHIYFDKPGPDGHCAVLFVDGHVELLKRDFLVDGATSSATSLEDFRTLWFGFPDATVKYQY
ncbi:MAG TPA: type II secretion system protein [Terrimicrobiaceae bacterium]|nr:type II secretion system protein [Terrimicrobiaceae bacterium]